MTAKRTTKKAATERSAAQGRATKAPRDPRLPAVGTVLTREHDGKSVKVKVTEDGFVLGRKTYSSLSAVAQAITGTSWNGYTFFGLGGKAKGKGESR